MYAHSKEYHIGYLRSLALGCVKKSAAYALVMHIEKYAEINYFGIPFYVCAPFSTIDFDCPTGGEIIIERRDASEITDMHYKKKMTHPGVKVYNPAFDVTPAGLITGIVTERGVFKGGELLNEKQ